MSGSPERYFLDCISGRRRGAIPSLLRAGLAAAEPGYGAVVRVRNGLYDRGFPHATVLPLATVSVGNITTGGTGKTPLVAWLIRELRAAGRQPAVLMRGYKKRAGAGGDEEILLGQTDGKTPVVADPDRQRGAAGAMAWNPHTDLFILDDGMQHRRVARDVEIVVVSAVLPWGFNHLLPRGLLREPLGGLGRADVLVVTHASEASALQLQEIESTCRRYNAAAPIVFADHFLSGLLALGDQAHMPMAALAATRYWIACGIGQPESFRAALQSYGKNCTGETFYPDHHHFTEEDVAFLRRSAGTAGAQAIVVTEKDWTKLASLSAVREPGIPFWRAQLQIRFAEDGGKKLLGLISQRISARRSGRS